MKKPIRKVLLVDPSHYIQSFVRGLLSNVGFEVVTLDGLRDMMHYIRDVAPDLCIIDWDTQAEDFDDFYQQWKGGRPLLALINQSPFNEKSKFKGVIQKPLQAESFTQEFLDLTIAIVQ